jgi:hypothetical protein
MPIEGSFFYLRMLVLSTANQFRLDELPLFTFDLA